VLACDIDCNQQGHRPTSYNLAYDFLAVLTFKLGYGQFKNLDNGKSSIVVLWWRSTVSP
jgi:hypothetical protein